MFLKSYEICKKIEFTVFPVFLYFDLGTEENEYFTLDSFFDKFVLDEEYKNIREFVFFGEFSDSNLDDLLWITPRLFGYSKSVIICVENPSPAIMNIIYNIPSSRYIVEGDSEYIKGIIKNLNNLSKTDIILISEIKNNTDITNILKGLSPENSPAIFINRGEVTVDFLKKGNSILPTAFSDPLLA